MMLLASICSTASKDHPRRNRPDIQYGTAGFRTRADYLDDVVFRTAILAALRSKQTEATIGLMITASHNPECDNGVKVVDPMGEMLDQKWEKYATALANSSNEDLEKAINNILNCEEVNLTRECSVLLGRDTRKSSLGLAQAAADALTLMQCSFIDHGQVTTPQLHFMIRCSNTKTYGAATEEGYYIKLGAAFNQLMKEVTVESFPKVYIDGSNGVGAAKFNHLKRNLRLDIEVFNDGSTGELNHKCGADFVKIEQTFPNGFPVQPGWKCCSIDGDADRIVYFYEDTGGKFRLLDGDKIAVLFANQLKDLLEQAGVKLNVEVVQTAYANGSSTKYLSETLGLSVACVLTGVKHLYNRAVQMDVGIMFEANGHGMILFSEKAFAEIAAAQHDNRLSPTQQAAASQLKIVIDLVNQTVGDAISNLLLVEYILYSRSWTIQNWDKLYTDLPSRQLKVKVHDRSVITTTDAERHVVTPVGLQEAIDKAVANVVDGRSFARPSGTEDIVRIYAEANTQEAADGLAAEVASLVRDLAGGVD